MKKFFTFLTAFAVSFILVFTVSFSGFPTAKALTVSTEPDILPAPGNGNVWNMSMSVPVRIFSFDGYLVGTYYMDFIINLSYNASKPTQNVEVVLSFSLPQDFVINGTSIDRELIEVVSFLGLEGDNLSFWIPKVGDVPSSVGWTENQGATTSYDGCLGTIRPAGYANDDATKYYWSYRFYANGTLEAFRSSFPSSSAVTKTPLKGSKAFNALTNIKYKNGVFFDSPYFDGYSSRVHNSYNVAYIGYCINASFYAYFNNTSFQPLFGPYITMNLPYEYLDLANDGFLTSLKSDIEDLKSLKSDVASLTNSYNSLNSKVTTLTSDLSSLTTKVNNLTNSVNGLNTSVGNLNTQVTNLSSSVSSMSLDITTLQNQYNSLSADIQSLESGLSGLKSTLDSINSKLTVLSGMNTTITSMNKTLINIETALNLMKNSMKDYSDVLSTISSGISTVNTNLGKINTSLGNIDKNISNVNTALTTVNSNLDKLNTGMQNLNTGIQNLNKMFEDFANVSSDVLEDFKESMQKLDSIDQQLKDLASSLDVPKTDVSKVNIDVSAIGGIDFSASTSFLGTIVNLPFISMILLLVFTFALMAYVLHGKKG